MKAVMCRQWGPPEQLVVEDVPTREPGQGEVRIRIHAASVNFPDVLIIQNKYQFKPELPFIPGSEGAGEVISVGEGVTHVKAGDRVLANTGTGSFAQEMIARFHDRTSADRALENFEARFKQGLVPDDLVETALDTPLDGYPIANLLKDLNLTASTSESIRMIKQGGVKIDGEKIEDGKISLKKGAKGVIQVGKRKFAKFDLT
jgi:hypothetical protein